MGHFPAEINPRKRQLVELPAGARPLGGAATAAPLRTKRSRVSAGLLMYRFLEGSLEVFIAHPGGPWFPNRDFDVWTIPKGELEPGEALFSAALREFEEEVGLRPHGPFIELGSIRQKGGKTVHAWAFEGQWEEGMELRTTYFSMEWPPGSGQRQEFPEIDRVGFFSLTEARERMKIAQQPLLDRLVEAVASLYPTATPRGD